MAGRYSTNEIWYQVEGEGDPVLILLGVGGRIENAAPIVRALRAHHTVLSFDYPGLGRSTARIPRDLAGYEAILPGLLTDAGIERAHLLAISFGVPVALQFAAAAPGRVRSLALLSGVARADSRLRRVSRVLGDAARRLPPESFARLAVTLLFPPAFDAGREALVDAVERSLAPERDEMPFIAHQTELAAGADVRAVLPQVSKRARVWIGDLDAFVPVWLARELAEALPNCELTVVPGAGHSLLAERPREMYEQLLAFFAGSAGLPPA